MFTGFMQEGIERCKEQEINNKHQNEINVLQPPNKSGDQKFEKQKFNENLPNVNWKISQLKQGTSKPEQLEKDNSKAIFYYDTSQSGIIIFSLETSLKNYGHKRNILRPELLLSFSCRQNSFTRFRSAFLSAGWWRTAFFTSPLDAAGFVVLVQIWFQRKRFSTVLANVLSRRTVRLHVSAKIATVGEGLSTATPEGLFSCMASQMTLSKVADWTNRTKLTKDVNANNFDGYFILKYSQKNWV